MPRQSRREVWYAAVSNRLLYWIWKRRFQRDLRRRNMIL